MTKRPYEVHIDSVALPAGTVGTRAIRAAIEREVARAIKARGPTGDAALGPIEVSVGKATAPRAIGLKVAEAAGAKLTKR